MDSAPFTGLSPRCLGKLVSALRREGADPVRRGRPWSLPLEDWVLLAHQLMDEGIKLLSASRSSAAETSTRSPEPADRVNAPRCVTRVRDLEPVLAIRAARQALTNSSNASERRLTLRRRLPHPAVPSSDA